ncbi:MAG: DPP IV N-terminal domain-containing protein [Salibacteraceae bacterium]|nr:DPP IV N-terminal domain-containing protein [Salibacteraceae bacterium]MDP4763977.1 DPP IV N-terminal domain-containing protein [Salibacteraceae bacterium]
MKHLYFLAIACLLQGSIFAQDTEITLEESVLNQYAKYYPLPQSGLGFLPSGNFYTYNKTDEDGKSLLMKGTSKTGSEKPWFSLDELKSWNAGELEKLSRMPRFNWLNDNEAVFEARDGKYIKLNAAKRSAQVLTVLPENAEEVLFNHDYSAVAYVFENNLMIAKVGGETVQITNDGSEAIVYGKAVHRNEFGINGGLFWSKDGQHLAFYRMDQSMVTQYPLVHITTKPAETEMIYYPMAGMKSHHVSLGLVNLSNPEARYIKPEGDPEQYLTSVAWSPDAKSVFIGLLNRDQNDLNMTEYNAQTLASEQVVFNETSKTFVEPEQPFWFEPGNEDQKYWFSERSGQQWLYRYSKEYDGVLLFPGMLQVQEILGFNQSTRTLILKGTGEVKRNGPITDASRNGTQTYTYLFTVGNDDTPRMLNDRIGTHSAMVSEDGNYIIEHFSSIETPLETTIYTLDGKKVKTIHSLENPLNGLKIGKSELITLNSGNGDLLYGRIVKPSDFEPNKKYPVLVYVYGGPHAQLVTNTFNAGASLWMNWFAEQGYIVATIDNRGSGNRGQAFEDWIFRNAGAIEMEDQYTLVSYLKDQSWTDNSKFAVHGWSYGGYMTTNMLLSFPGEFVCGVAGGPVCNWEYYEVMYTERYMDTPASNPEGYKATNLVARAADLKDDLMIIHGTIDDVVVWQHSQAFVQACIDAGAQLDYFIYPEHPHNVRGKDRAHLITKILNYVEDHIGSN